MSPNFLKALAATLAHEGGWSNHPRDPGGATNKGITLTTFREWRRDPRLTATHLREISDAEVAEIYQALYWNALHADELPGGVDVMVFDMGVNAGVRRSALQLQEALGFTGRDRDGVIGPKTLGAARAADPVTLIAALGELHEAHYRSLPTFDTFGRGWMARLTKRLALAHQMLTVT